MDWQLKRVANHRAYIQKHAAAIENWGAEVADNDVDAFEAEQRGLLVA